MLAGLGAAWPKPAKGAGLAAGVVEPAAAPPKLNPPVAGGLGAGVVVPPKLKPLPPAGAGAGVVEAAGVLPKLKAAGLGAAGIARHQNG